MHEGGHILVVDDDADVREVLRLFLEGRGFRVREAENGADALDALARERPSLILLDMMMPVMSGPELLERMRPDPELASIPVLLVTAWPGQVAGTPGIAGVISKPVDIRELAARIEEHLGRAR